MNEIKEYAEKMFEDIKRIDENNVEYWLARELMEVLEYKKWRKFNKVIEKQWKRVMVVIIVFWNILSLRTK